ncbi:SusC/RagA family TonB-linked outer membrane protein [Ornithobacterium rhinotracheale]|uniref:SusC/RagA family TonB-linked outer membrane protein n=1 Tax=Ornithobacterium rhinotracheale TaxID=28251 RepID=A0A410JRV4_ORNRH|nr:SusC/RagA family TonB-linked outer membrane protein [Ornithobacterium rhinotracheale]MRJ08797.1 SusC/RagA family TonB-linked outer membrane protein [Ornithobacterium rhinotracheale]QAR30854.1 SusC/RagA family TonB-linked outer membrane protein [Ornithobacterium rhinotracheale]UOH77059.1 SusC/RagA family TonB-linked outer membrane protein [Ornithobacterium rhinotracheale]
MRIKFYWSIFMLLLISSFSFAQVTGKVEDDYGPLEGVGVTVIGGQHEEVYTNSQGEFDVNAKIGDKLRLVNPHNLSEKVVNVTKNDLGTIVMKEKEINLDVVVGYGSIKKESLTGSLSTINPKDLKDATTPNVENLLNSKVSGVYVAPGSGQPGSRGAVIIRGKSTVNGSTAPLWVIDGVIVGSNPGALNPSDIESMTVLKDAASTAIYGSQGANGVILVTTKNAKSGDIKTFVNSKIGFTKLNNGNLEIMNGAELYEYYKSFSNSDIINFPRWNDSLRNANFDWWKFATQTGFIQDYYVSLNGGSDKLKGFFSADYYNEKGAVKGYKYDKFDFRFKLDFAPVSWLNVKPAIFVSKRYTDNKEHSITAMYSNFPWDSPFDKNGNVIPNRSDKWVNSTRTNYVYDMQWNKGKSESLESFGNLDFDVKLLEWLTFSSINNIKIINSKSDYYTDPRSSGGEGVRGRLNKAYGDVTRRYTNQLFRIKKSFGLHDLNGVVGYEYNDFNSDEVGAQGTGFIPGFEVLNVTALPEKVSGKINEWAVQSLLSNFNYSYDNRYMAQLSLRRDGASNFGENAKYGNFYSLSAGWNIHHEKWFDVKHVDTFKLRTSLGTVGNRPNVLYPQYDLYSVTAKYNEVSGALISQIGNKDLTWEKTRTIGVGFDLGIFKRINLTFDYYNKFTDNLLYYVPISGLMGVTGIWRNVGELENNGFEFTADANVVNTNKFSWDLKFNISKNKNEIKSLYGDKKQIIIGDGIGIAGSANRILKPGYSADTYYIREWAGVNPDDGSPQWYKTVKDQNGKQTREKTSKYAEADQVILGSATPDFYGGIATTLRYDKFDLTMTFGFSKGGKIYNYSRTEYDSDGAYVDRNQMKLQKGWSRWEKAGDKATHPVAIYNNPSNSNKVSSRYLEDADYFKMRSLTLGYELDLSKYKLPNTRISLSGENLFTITDYSGVDPELPASGGSVLTSAGPAVYPSTRKFLISLSFNL